MRREYAVTYLRVCNYVSLDSALEEQGWDIIVCMHKEPEFDSLAIMSRVRAKGLEIPFFVIYSPLDDEIKLRSIIEGADACIPKSKMERLTPAVERVLSGRSRSGWVSRRINNMQEYEVS